MRWSLPLAVFVVLLAFLFVGLFREPREVPSPLVDKPAPAFWLAKLHRPGERRGTFGERLVLAHEAAQLRLERLQPCIERIIGERRRGGKPRHDEQQARHDRCSSRTSGRIVLSSASAVSGPICL